MIEAVLFELEGVLADTGEVRRSTLLRALADDGVPLTDAEYEECCAARPLRGALESALALRGAERDDTALDLLALRTQREFASWLGKGVALAPGARELVESLLGRVRLGIVARAPRQNVEFVLSLAHLEHAFECIVAEEDAYPPKPDPAPYRAALARLSRRRPLAAARAVAFEDGPVGLRSARGAGFRAIAVGPLAAHLALEGDALVSTLSSLTLETMTSLLSSRGELIR